MALGACQSSCCTRRGPTGMYCMASYSGFKLNQPCRVVHNRRAAEAGVPAAGRTAVQQSKPEPPAFAAPRRSTELGAAAVAALAAWASCTPALAAESAAALSASAAASSGYVPSPYEPGWEVWFGAVAGVIPFVIATVEFSKRIIIQRRCPRCSGRGLVSIGGKRPLNADGTERLRKCPECGGMLPWLGWKEFFFSTASPGNGGPLLQPRGQTSIFYKVPPKPPAEGSSPTAASDSGSSAGSSKRASIDRSEQLQEQNK